MKYDDVVDYVSEADNETLIKLNDLIKDKFKQNSNVLKYKLMPGDTVRVSGSSRIEEGTVIKVNRTRALVKVYDKVRKFDVKYHVPFTMLTKITEEGNNVRIQ